MCPALLFTLRFGISPIAVREFGAEYTHKDTDKDTLFEP